MLSRDDYKAYLGQLHGIEKQMSDLYERCASMASDQDIAQTCEAISKQEAVHARLIEELESLLGGSR